MAFNDTALVGVPTWASPKRCLVADQSKGGIDWTDTTWNPVRGCSRVSPGCENCYAEAVAARFSGPGQPYEGLAHRAGDLVQITPGHVPRGQSTPAGVAWCGSSPSTWPTLCAGSGLAESSSTR